MSAPAPWEHSITASEEHIDILGHVNNAVWVQWMEAVSVSHWEAMAREEDKAAYIWVVLRHEIDYRGNVVAGETVTARTWIPDGPKGAKMDRRMDFIGPDGKVKVSARTTWAMLDAQSLRPVRVTPEIAAPFVG